MGVCGRYQNVKGVFSSDMTEIKRLKGKIPNLGGGGK
jgi:hypothetical protein